MKYLDPSFAVPLTSKEYGTGWDRIFGKKEEPAPEPKKKQPHSVREALTAMGYREHTPGKWVKPIGAQAFAFYEDIGQWINWFRAGGGEVSCWERKTLQEDIEHGDYLSQIKSFETHARTDICVNGDLAEFHLDGIDLSGAK